MDKDFKPILRYIDAIPSSYQGKPVLLLRDPIGFCEEIVILPQHMGILLLLLDGKHTLEDVQKEISKHFKKEIPLEEIKKIIEFLDDKGLLWSKKFEEIKNKAYEKWLSLRVRPMAHANQAYPLSPAEAKFFVEDILKLAKEDTSSNPPKVLIAPHIDLRLGARGFAESYSRFKIPTGARIIILGVGHHLDYPFSVLTKDIATPFGIVRNDKGGFFYLANSKKIQLFPDHMAHKLEHSIEFQLLFLHYLLKDEFVVLPILMGPLVTLIQNEKLVKDLAIALSELIDDQTYIVLGIDFCHLGLRYGDPFSASFEHGQKAIELDKKLIELSFNGNSKELLELIKENEKMKICGNSCLYLLSLILENIKLKGNCEIYYQDVIPFGQGSVVSIASAGYIVQ